MVITGGNSLDPAEATHLHRREAGGGPVAQLARADIAPGHDRPVGLQRQAVVVPGTDGLDPAKPAHPYRREAAGVGAVAQLAEVVAAPCPDRPVGFSARLWTYPTEMALIPLSPLTCTGMVRSVVVASPSWPA